MSGEAVSPHLLVGVRAGEGAIVTVYVDAEGMHYVVLVGGRLVNVAADQLTVLDDREW
jgi:hypothetical protein